MISHDSRIDNSTPRITRVRHDLKRRLLQVTRVERLTPVMLRIAFTGDALADFISPGADDHVKIFVPGPGGEMVSRDYTPRACDAAARTLVIDFAVHDAGPATLWALNARPGDQLEIGGPRGSMVIGPDIGWWLLVGDETALPAIGRRIEELPAGARVISLVAVPGRSDEQTFVTSADHQALWVHRPSGRADDPEPVLRGLETLQLPQGDGFVWIAAEARVARAARQFLVERRGHPLPWLKASGYWVRGVADASDKLIE